MLIMIYELEPVKARRVEEITGVSAVTLKQHIARGLVSPDAITGGGAKGRDHRFAFNSVIEVAVAAKLTRLGIAASTAYEIAREFAQNGDSGSGWGDGPSETLVRRPGLPFHHRHGDTFLCWDGDAVVVTVDRAEYPIALNVTDIFCDLARKFDLDPFAALDAEYGDG